MFSYIRQFFDLFLKLPKSVQVQIIDAIIFAFSFAYRRFFKTKSKEDLKKATDEAVTPKQWNATTLAVRSYVPSLYSSEKKAEFAQSIIELVKSNDFINELGNRIEKVHAEDEETYVALCSIETKKLIIEMMDKTK